MDETMNEAAKQDSRKKEVKAPESVFGPAIQFVENKLGNLEGGEEVIEQAKEGFLSARFPDSPQMQLLNLLVLGRRLLETSETPSENFYKECPWESLVKEVSYKPPKIGNPADAHRLNLAILGVRQGEPSELMQSMGVVVESNESGESRWPKDIGAEDEILVMPRDEGSSSQIPIRTSKYPLEEVPSEAMARAHGDFVKRYIVTLPKWTWPDAFLSGEQSPLALVFYPDADRHEQVYFVYGSEEMRKGGLQGVLRAEPVDPVSLGFNERKKREMEDKLKSFLEQAMKMPYKSNEQLKKEADKRRQDSLKPRFTRAFRKRMGVE